MPFEKPLRALYDHQIDCHTVPSDMFSEPEFYHTRLGNPLEVNGQKYRAFVVPGCQALPKAAAEGIETLIRAGLPVFFVEPKPQTVAQTGKMLPPEIREMEAIPLDRLYEAVKQLSLKVPILAPAEPRIRVLHILSDPELYFLVNEGNAVYRGTLTLPTAGSCYAYDPWFNACREISASSHDADTRIALTIEPLKPVFIVFGTAPGADSGTVPAGEELCLTTWQRSICAGAEYPALREKQTVTLPDCLAKEKPGFSGFVRYETTLPPMAAEVCLLEISDAAEGVEVFLNGESLGIQIAPPMRYLLPLSAQRENQLVIEVATTLERQVYPTMNLFQKWMYGKPAGGSGLTGTVKLIQSGEEPESK